MKIAVIGGTGNISSAIVSLLLDIGHEVTCFCRGTTRNPRDDVRWIIGNRLDRDDFERKMINQRFDAVIDMICFNAEDAQSAIRAFPDIGQYLFCSTVCTYGIHYDWMPVTEDHPQRPTTEYGKHKLAAEAVFLGEYFTSGFPVTILRPSTTYGPIQGMLRQIAWDFSWIDRTVKRKPLVVSGDGLAIHQHMHVRDAAQAFAYAIGNDRCIGEAYNVVNPWYVDWVGYHKTANKILNSSSPLVGIPMAQMKQANVPNMGILEDEFAYNCYYSPEKIFRHMPEFHPSVDLETGMEEVLETMFRENRIPDSDMIQWEDQLISDYNLIT